VGGGGGYPQAPPFLMSFIQAEPTPLPNPPPQGGRESTPVLMACRSFT